MTVKDRADFLVEIGTEELPPKALRSLMEAFATHLDRLLVEHRLQHGGVSAYASPRRLAALVEGLAATQPSREIENKGPPVSVAFDEQGNAKPAAAAFAKKCGVTVEQLGRLATDKGEWLVHRSVESGATARELLAGIVEQALQALPIPRRMRWGDSDIEFVRPVHWVLMIQGDDIVPGRVLGHEAGRSTFGHRFMASGAIDIAAPAEYLVRLEREGYVIADFDAREARVREQVAAAAASAGGRVEDVAALYEEVTALTEWPVAMAGEFDPHFLALPPEVIIASLTGHQRYFPVLAEDGGLLAAFVVVANLESRDPAEVREGNERVIRPRLADAQFFWDTDRRTTLADRRAALDRVVYQQGLGSMRDKSVRVASLCATIAAELGTDIASATRAAELAKCDLLTGMVGEFPELQGVMGAYYAAASGEPEAVATAIREQYQPRFAGDAVPASAVGQVLAIADKLDTLAGIFALGQKPSGNRDPFGLRRAALGVLRILIEGRLELDLRAAVDAAVALQPISDGAGSEVAGQLFGFVTERLRSYYTERPGVSAEIFEAVATASVGQAVYLPDFDQRIQAVVTFVGMNEAESLAAANKRISNILQQSGDGHDWKVDTGLFSEKAESALYDALQKALRDVAPLQAERDYARVLARLALLREPVDRFFEEVLVMADEEALKKNRLALLARLREPFHSVADISRLSGARSAP